MKYLTLSSRIFGLYMPVMAVLFFSCVNKNEINANHDMGEIVLKPAIQIFLLL